MAKQNGSNSGTLDIGSFVKTQQSNLTRLAKLAEQKAKVDEKAAVVLAEQAEIQDQINAIMGVKVASPVAKPTNGKASKPAATKATKATSNGTGNGRGRRGNGNGGQSMNDVLLSVLPSNSEDGISKDEIATRIAAAGYTSNSTDPKIVIGQALGKSRDFQNVSRGIWRLSKFGEAAKAKLMATPAASTPDAVADAPAAPVADASPVVPLNDASGNGDASQPTA